MRTSVRQFRSAPRINPDVSFKFIAYGDMGLSGIPGAFDIAKFMSEEAANGTSLIFHVGDISYARGYVSRNERNVYYIRKHFCTIH